MKYTAAAELLKEGELLDGALDYALAQAEDLEIEGALVLYGGMSKDAAANFVAENSDAIWAARLAGKADVRRAVYEMVTTGSCRLNGSAMNLLSMFARAHLGWAKAGVDEEVRRQLEAIEREQAARSKKLGRGTATQLPPGPTQ